MKQLFVIMCRDYLSILSTTRQNDLIAITLTDYKITDDAYFGSYTEAVDALNLIRNHIDNAYFNYAHSDEWDRPSVDDFYIAEVSFNRYMPVAGNTISNKFENVKYKVGDKVIFVISGVIYVGKIEIMHVHSIDDLPANNNYSYDILATDKTESSKFIETLRGDYPLIPITDTEVIFESVLEDTIIGLF